MPCTFRSLFLLLTVLTSLGLVATGFDAAAKEKKEDKKDVKKEDKKEEKKEPFKADPADIELKYLDKKRSFWVSEVAFAADGKSVVAVYRPHTVVVWDLDTKKESKIIKGPEL